MRTTGFGFSIFLLAVGAVMAWAINVETEGVNLNTVGLILFFVGLAGFIGTFALASTPQKKVVTEDRTDVRVDSRV